MEVVSYKGHTELNKPSVPNSTPQDPIPTALPIHTSTEEGPNLPQTFLTTCDKHSAPCTLAPNKYKWQQNRQAPNGPEKTSNSLKNKFGQNWPIFEEHDAICVPFS